MFSKAKPGPAVKSDAWTVYTIVPVPAEAGVVASAALIASADIVKMVPTKFPIPWPPVEHANSVALKSAVSAVPSSVISNETSLWPSAATGPDTTASVAAVVPWAIVIVTVVAAAGTIPLIKLSTNPS